ncbi:hypothetical protein H1164_06755, partial [Thermoactinomyces daqus]|nr:hypothetical protein [Thermoactinomyces daqus]
MSLIKRIHLGSEEQVRQILQVQQAAYRVEAKMIGCEELPPLVEVAEKNNIPYQIEIMTGGGTDAGQFHLYGKGT